MHKFWRVTMEDNNLTRRGHLPVMRGLHEADFPRTLCVMQSPRFRILLPHFTVFKVLLLPDGYACLDLVNCPMASL